MGVAFSTEKFNASCFYVRTKNCGRKDNEIKIVNRNPKDLK